MDSMDSVGDRRSRERKSGWIGKRAEEEGTHRRRRRFMSANHIHLAVPRQRHGATTLLPGST